MERDFIDWLNKNVPRHPRAELGLTDDAALLSIAEPSKVVVTTDMLNDGVDFRVSVDDPRRIGRQALGANLSDLAAMAAKPVAAFISIALPRPGGTGPQPLELAKGVYEGILALAAEYDVAIAGGDTNSHDGPLVISVTAIGETTKCGPLTRSNGQVGDWLLVTGKLGGSLLGHMFGFTPRVREALFLNEHYKIHACIDISDGLALDASRLAKASGVGAVIRTEQVPISPDAFTLSDQDGAADRDTAALQHALSDGQDFELLLALDADVARKIINDQPLECGLTHVGELVAEHGLWQQGATGQRLELPPIGYLH